MFKPQDTLDRVFEIGIIAKGLNGLAELVGGLLLLFVSPGDIHHLVAMVTQGEAVGRSTRRHRPLLTAYRGWTYGERPTLRRRLLAGAWRRQGRTGDRAIAEQALGISLHDHGPVDLHRLPAVSDCAAAPSMDLVALTVFDAVIVVLTSREYRRQQRIPDRPPATDSAPRLAVER
jgi:hypothetical protein